MIWLWGLYLYKLHLISRTCSLAGTSGPGLNCHTATAAWKCQRSARSLPPCLFYLNSCLASCHQGKCSAEFNKNLQTSSCTVACLGSYQLDLGPDWHKTEFWHSDGIMLGFWKNWGNFWLNFWLKFFSEVWKCENTGAWKGKLLEWSFVFQVQCGLSIEACAVALYFRSGIGTKESSVRSSYAHQCYMNMSE